MERLHGRASKQRGRDPILLYLAIECFNSPPAIRHFEQQQHAVEYANLLPVLTPANPTIGDTHALGPAPRIQPRRQVVVVPKG